jgi:hypothetical protein
LDVTTPSQSAQAFLQVINRIALRKAQARLNPQIVFLRVEAISLKKFFEIVPQVARELRRLRRKLVATLRRKSFVLLVSRAGIEPTTRR